MTQQTLHVRKATPDDRGRILEISVQIWDGDDYVPQLLDSWLAEDEGELVVTTLDDVVIAFAHRSWLCPGIAWFEGIRTDPAHQGRGAGKAITEYLIGSAHDAGATRIALSTYIDNKASIHIIESYGFRLTATFSYLERAGDLPPPQEEDRAASIRELTETETREFIGTSAFLSMAQRQLSHGWKFLPFDHDPSRSIEPLAYRVGYWEEDELTAVLCIRQEPAIGGPITLSFLDGESAAMSRLLNHALNVYEGSTMQVMVPVHQGRRAAAFAVLRESGFISWSDFHPDVFVYEMVLSSPKEGADRLDLSPNS
ncbi:GNAT family N-acetyltransferase [Candidatus Bipolaricaulota bacterium]|nr:GNAT family N-acetyltransferase [Candidatus Bipolaricaulota bacterium]TFH10216.1 MAG: GNAT family N-acetyltransferase [Candidatus Atribacteria bacterium]